MCKPRTLAAAAALSAREHYRVTLGRGIKAAGAGRELWKSKVTIQRGSEWCAVLWRVIDAVFTT